MNIRQIFSAFLCLGIVAVLFGGCKAAPQNNTESMISSEIVTVTNPFDTDDIKASSNSEIIANFGVYVNKENVEYLTYENDRLVLPLTVQNEGSDMTLGFFVFVDGVVQEYSSENNENKAIMQTFAVEAESVSAYELYIDNIQTADNKHNMNLSFMTIVNPDFVPTLDNISNKTTDMYSCGVPIPLHMESEPVISDMKILTEYDSHVISDEDKHKYNIITEIDDSTTSFQLYDAADDERPINMIAYNDNGTLELKLIGFSVNQSAVTYRISFFKNNQRIQFNEGYDYLDIEQRSGYFSSADIRLDGISENDFVYCIAEPIDSYDVTAKKSVRISAFNEAEMPEKTDDYKDYKPIVPEITEEKTESDSEDYDDSDETLPQHDIVIIPEELDDGYYPLY